MLSIATLLCRETTPKRNKTRRLPLFTPVHGKRDDCGRGAGSEGHLESICEEMESGWKGLASCEGAERRSHGLAGFRIRIPFQQR